MKSIVNHFILSFPKERKVGSLYLPQYLGEEEGVFAREVGTVVSLPSGYTKKMLIPCSMFGETMTVKDIEHTFAPVKEGDSVFVSYLATADEHRRIMDDGDNVLYSVPAHLIIAIVDGESLIPVADKVIICPSTKHESQLLIGTSTKHQGVGVVAYNAPPYEALDKVIYLEKLAYPFTFAGVEYEAVYSEEVLAKIEPV